MAESRRSATGIRDSAHSATAVVATELEASSPLRRLFGHQARALRSYFQNVEVAASSISRIHDFIVRGLGLDLHRDPVTFTADAFDFDHRIAPWSSRTVSSQDRRTSCLVPRHVPQHRM